jgi:hypothetical protein
MPVITDQLKVKNRKKRPLQKVKGFFFVALAPKKPFGLSKRKTVSNIRINSTTRIKITALDMMCILLGILYSKDKA